MGKLRLERELDKLRFFMQELEEIRIKEMITEEQYQSIKEEYETRITQVEEQLIRDGPILTWKNISRKWERIALYLGAFLILSALLIFIGGKWSYFSKYTKTFLLLMLNYIAYAGGYLILKRKGMRNTGLALMIIASILSYGSLIYLADQYFGFLSNSEQMDVLVIISLVCSIIYSALAYIVDSKVFMYISSLTLTISYLVFIIRINDLLRMQNIPLFFAFYPYGLLGLGLGRTLQRYSNKSFATPFYFLGLLSILGATLVRCITPGYTGSETLPYLALLIVISSIAIGIGLRYRLKSFLIFGVSFLFLSIITVYVSYIGPLIPVELSLIIGGIILLMIGVIWRGKKGKIREGLRGW